MSNIGQILHTISYMALPLLLAMVFHEYAHGWVANRYGDSTARLAGRLTLDPSHYIYGPHAGQSYDQLMRLVYNVHLRDTSKDKLQVRVGQGLVEYGRLITQLTKVHYNRTLVVHIAEMPDVDHAAEMRKMRLLLESLL